MILLTNFEMNHKFPALSATSIKIFKVESLLSKLSTKGSSALTNFSLALEDDYDWLAHALKNTSVSQREVEEYTSSASRKRLSTIPRHIEVPRPQEEHRSQEGDQTRISKGILDQLPNSGSSGSWRPGEQPGFGTPPGLVGSGRNPMNCSSHSSSWSPNSPGYSSQSSTDLHSPLHSSQASQCLKRKVEEMEDEEITEDMIEFVMENPRVMRRWTNLAHQAGLSSRIPVIQARVRSEGRDHDEHVGELLREWRERRPGEATRSGLAKLLRTQNFNDTAGKIEDGSYVKKLKV